MKVTVLSEKLVSKLRSSSMISGTIIYLATNILNAAIPFALLPILTRYLTPAEYGQVAMFQTFLGALGAFIGLNVVGAATRKYYDPNLNTEGMKAFIASCLQILFFSTLAVLVIVWNFQRQLSEWLDINNTWLFEAIIISAMAVVINLRLTQWQVKKKPYHYGVLQISQSVANMSLSLLLVAVFLQGAEGRIKAQLWATTAIFFTSLALLKHEKLLNLFIWKPSYIREALNFGVPFIPHAAGAFLLTSVDRFVINTELGLEKAGIYMLAVQISLVLALIFDSINKAYVPWLYERLKRNIEEEKKKIVKYTYIWYVCIILGVTFAFFTGPWFINLISNEKYSEAGTIIGWLALGQGLRGMYLIVTNYIFYAKRTGLLSLTTISSGIINVILLIVIVPILGIKGAAIAYSISMGTLFITTWILAQQVNPMPWFSPSKY